MIRQQQALCQQLPGHLEKCDQILGVFKVRNLIAHLPVYLCQCRPPKALAATGKIHQQQLSVELQIKFGGNALAHISNRCKSGNHQR